MSDSFHHTQLPERREPDSILLAGPEYFQVVDKKNPYMKEAIDHGKAMEQWKTMEQVYRKLASEGNLKEVSVIPGVEDLEDMVFCANQSLPFLDDNGNKKVIMSNMRHDSRQREVSHFEDFYIRLGYQAIHMPADLLIEGMGDCIFHPFKSLLWMGSGFRTSPETAPVLESKLGIPVIPLQLVSNYFYHLDTCFLPVNQRKVLLCEEAFSAPSLDKIRSVFDEVVAVSRQEAVDTFCLNAHCIYHREKPVAVLPGGEHLVKKELVAEGYQLTEVDTSEFIKSGGSVYCMKMMYYG